MMSVFESVVRGRLTPLALGCAAARECGSGGERECTRGESSAAVRSGSGTEEAVHFQIDAYLWVAYEACGCVHVVAYARWVRADK